MEPTVKGYPQIAYIMRQHRELANFRQFGHLNMLTLLHMQAEIMLLEEKYELISAADQSNTNMPFRSRDWWTLAQLDCEGNRAQWDLLLQIKEKLKEYSEGNPLTR